MRAIYTDLPYNHPNGDQTLYDLEIMRGPSTDRFLLVLSVSPINEGPFNDGLALQVARGVRDELNILPSKVELYIARGDGDYDRCNFRWHDIGTVQNPDRIMEFVEGGDAKVKYTKAELMREARELLEPWRHKEKPINLESESLRPNLKDFFKEPDRLD